MEKYEEIRSIEAEYLEPEVHSLMEVSGYTVGPEDCARLILLVEAPKSNLRGTHVLKYIEWGESKGYHKGSTCASRVTDTRGWYDLTGHRRGNLFWPMAQQYKHAIPHNEHNLIANHNLFDVIPHNRSPDVLGGILNSSFVVLSKFLYGRPVGNEGNLKTEVIDVTMMPVPDPTNAQEAILERIAESFRELKRRPAMQFLSARRLRRMAYTRAEKEIELQEISDLCELDMDDRRTLDDAVLEMLGVQNQRERGQLLDRLYSYLREFFESVRQKEEIAIGNKNRSKRKAALSATDIAGEILAEVRDRLGHLLRPYRDFVDLSRPYSTFEVPAAGVAEMHADIFAPDGSVRFMKGRKQIAILPTKTKDQATLVVAIANQGIRGLTRVPLEPEDCTSLRKRYEAFVEDRARRLRAMISDRTGDPDLQAEIFQELSDLIQQETAE